MVVVSVYSQCEAFKCCLGESWRIGRLLTVLTCEMVSVFIDYG